MELRPTDKWLCLLACAFVVGGFVPIFIHRFLFDCALSLSPNSLLFKLWRKLPLDAPTDFYFFNWTNPQDINNKSIKPHFQEVGPYRYWQTEIKHNITWHDNGTITFLQKKFWKYDPAFGNDRDKITTINAIAVMAAHLTRNWSGFFRRGMFLTMSKALGNIHMTRTVDELVFNGYEEPLLQIAGSLPFFSHIPDWDKFAYYYTRNDSSEYDGVLNMDVTRDSLGKAYEYNYENKTHFYDGDCANVEGSFGQFFPRNPPQDFMKVFFLETHTTHPITYVGNETVSGMSGHKYVASERMLDNGTIYPENRCFCNGECVPSGLLNFSSIKYGMPIFGSLPHFYRADPYFLGLIDGLQPQPDKHDFAFTIEPNTGIPLRIDIGIQANLLVQPVSSTGMFDNVPRFFFPVFWLKQKIEMTGFMALLIQLILAIPIICTVMGISMMVVGIGLLVRVTHRKYKLKSLRKKLNKEQMIPLKHDHAIIEP